MLDLDDLKITYLNKLVLEHFQIIFKIFLSHTIHIEDDKISEELVELNGCWFFLAHMQTLLAPMYRTKTHRLVQCGRLSACFCCTVQDSASMYQQEVVCSTLQWKTPPFLIYSFQFCSEMFLGLSQIAFPNCQHIDVLLLMSMKGSQ